MNNYRRLSLYGGIFWLITYATSIPALFIFYAPAIDQVDYVVGAGEDTRIATGAFLEMILIIANIATALLFLPILRRQNYTLAHGFVAARIMESVFIAIGLVSMLSLISLRSDFADGVSEGADGFITSGRTLVAIHDITFLLGPGIIVGVGNGLILGYLLYRSGLVPRALAILGMVAGSLLIIGSTLVMFDVVEPDNAFRMLLSAPEFFYELILGLYLVFAGFRSVPILRDALPPDRERVTYGSPVAVADTGSG